MNIFIEGFDCYTKINCAFERSNDKMRQASYTTIRYKSLFFASFNMKNNIAKEPCHPGFESLQSVLLNERDIQRISFKLFIAFGMKFFNLVKRIAREQLSTVYPY